VSKKNHLHPTSNVREVRERKMGKIFPQKLFGSPQKTVSPESPSYIHDDTVHLLEVTSTSTAVRVLTKRKRLIMSPKIDFFVYFP
jgi:hypothetical protein